MIYPKNFVLLRLSLHVTVPTFVARCEGLQQNEGDPYLNEILDMLTCLTTCGKTELKVSGNIIHPQLPQFDYEWTRSSGTVYMCGNLGWL